MGKKGSRKRAAVFISHAGVNLEAAQRVEAALDAAGFDPWLDRSDIRVGALLGRELRQAIEASKAVVLMWSKAAASSPWVATEVLTAFHLNRYIVPCVLSGTELPQFLSRSVYFDLRKRRADVLARLGDQVARAARARNEFPAVAHRKNAYMLKHWEAYCAGRFPPDALLAEGRTRLFATLFANPIDYTALNGLGNILLFAGELDAAEFFVQSAVKCAAREGVAYPEATHDLQLIRSRTRRSRRGQRRRRGRG
jgi:TIR domain